MKKGLKRSKNKAREGLFLSKKTTLNNDINVRKYLKSFYYRSL